jgi:hypothetical protein
MGRHAKRRVKQRSAAHRTWVKKQRRRRKHTNSKVGYGQRTRRRKKVARKRR